MLIKFKFADIWVIENVWAIIKDRLAAKKYTSLKSMKKDIVKIWREIDQDKPLCRRLISSMPKRFNAVITKKGEQIIKKDYQ